MTSVFLLELFQLELIIFLVALIKTALPRVTYLFFVYLFHNILTGKPKQHGLTLLSVKSAQGGRGR